MILGFDAKRVFNNFTGLGNYSRALLDNLQKSYPAHQYLLYSTKITSNNRTAPFCDSARFKSILPKTNFKAYWRSISVSKQLIKDHVDIYHGLSNELPFSIGKSSAKSVVTIHDLIFKVLPNTYPFIDRKIYDLKFRKSARLADVVIAVSENTKEDLVKFYGIIPDKIKVIYPPCSRAYYAPTSSGTIDIRQKYNLPNEFLLTVGAVIPRKNLLKVAEAYMASGGKLPPLVVVGDGKRYKQKIIQFLESNNLGHKFIWKSNLESSEDLAMLYRAANLMVYPSRYEGFGLPVAEALLSKTPVVTSNVSSLPEAGGPQSLQVNPDSAEEISEAINLVLSDENLRHKMKENGYNYARKFREEEIAKQMMELYTNLVEKKL